MGAEGGHRTGRRATGLGERFLLHYFDFQTVVDSYRFNLQKKKKKEKTFLHKEKKAHPAAMSDDGSEWVSSASGSPEGLGYEKMGLDSDRASGRGKEDGIKRFSGR